MKIYRICGYGSGRSELVVKLVEEFAFRRIDTAVIKHAHKPFDMDKSGSDTANLRASGCPQTLIAHRDRWGLLCETPHGGEPDPIALARHLAPCDLVLAVGFDDAPLPGLEVRRSDDGSEPLYRRDTRLHAVVMDGASGTEVPFCFARDQIEAIATHIFDHAEASTC
ncbi:molybdopterin-guanine dinucleotide biosynthesis protein B [Ferrigenium sp. UT5]|uniref:molybdopterin-guanine dinucleotide biosynthesis protein B n=1 Tax=Ferrigenium sp. UT5 TaxID=3242105 RepID=UPI0035534919